MSDLAAAGRVVARARLRLAVRRGLELAAGGALGGALVAIVAVCALRLSGGGAVPAPWMLVPVAGAVLGLGAGFLRPPAAARAALAVDRAAGTDEAFVSALTAADADRSFRELAATCALRGLGTRPLARLLPFGMPRRAAPAAVALALVVALAVLGRDAPGTGAVSDPPPASAAVTLTGAKGGAGAGPSRGAARAASRVPAPLPGVGPAAGPSPAVPAGGPPLTDADVRRLARDLAARGVAAGAAALEALRRGDRAAAEALLRGALAAESVASPVAAAGVTASAGRRLAGRGAPGAWSVGTWPLRYDREVRAWLRRQAVTDGGGDARTEAR